MLPDTECGLVFEKFNDLQEDDKIEAYAMVGVPLERQGFMRKKY